jgi:hypothetical protein
MAAWICDFESVSGWLILNAFWAAVVGSLLPQ